MSKTLILKKAKNEKKQPQLIRDPGATRERVDGERRIQVFNPVLHPGIVYRAFLAGYKADQVAEILGIEQKTLDRWIGTYPELRKARARALDADAEVAQSLFDMAVGVVDPVTGKRKGASVAAAIFWLKARRGWREDERGAKGETAPLDLRPEQVRALAEEVMEAMKEKVIQVTPESAESVEEGGDF